MTALDVVGFGALNVDKLFKVNCIAAAEEEGFVTSHEESCGGSAANTAVGLARLGCRVGFIGKVGRDHEGSLLLQDFRREGVDEVGVIATKVGVSGTVMGFVDEAGQRALYIHSGVNDAVAFEEIKPAYVSQAKFLHLTSFVGDKSFQTQKQLVKALPASVNVSFDPGALYARRGFAQLEPIIANTYVMMPNGKELEQITGEKDPKKGAKFLLRKGVKVVAVKLGGEGCYVTDGKQEHRLAALKVPVVDTTGAGDAYCAGFLYGLLKKKNLLECGKLGNFVASRCVMKLGARQGLPHKEDLKLLG
jgi:ribokinase